MQELKQVILDEPTSSFDIAGFTDSDYSSSDFSDDDDSYDLLPDIDQRNINNPTKIAKYAETIFCIAIKESSSIDLNNFFKVQKELTSDNHETAVKWLFNIQGQYQMSSNTLSLTKFPLNHESTLFFKCSANDGFSSFFLKNNVTVFVPVAPNVPLGSSTILIISKY